MFEHLGAHVVGGASEGGRQVRGPHEDARYAKVPQLHEVVLQEDVSRK